MARIRRVDDEREMEKVTDDFITQGYTVKNQGQRSTMMKKSTWGSGSGHLIVALFTIWFTLGVGNLIYAVYKHFTAEEVKIQVEDE